MSKTRDHYIFVTVDTSDYMEEVNKLAKQGYRITDVIQGTVDEFATIILRDYGKEACLSADD